MARSIRCPRDVVFHHLGNPFGLRGYRTQLGDTDYANCIVPPNYWSTPVKPRRYWFFKYRVSDDQLETWSMDFKATGRVIEAGSLAGQTERDPILTTCFRAKSKSAKQWLETRGRPSGCLATWKTDPIGSRLTQS